MNLHRHIPQPEKTSVRKLFLDCTFTRVHPANVGITRVVRKLVHELAAPRFGYELNTIAYSKDGFRTVPGLPSNLEITPPPEHRTRLQNLLTKLIIATTSQRLRTIVRKNLPLGVQARLLRIFSSATYGNLSQPHALACPGAGDIVFLCDASWNYAVEECVTQAKRTDAKIVTLVYDLIPLTHPQYCEPLFSLVFQRWLDRILEFSDAIVCISETTKQSVTEYGKRKGRRIPPIGAFHLGSDFSNTLPAKAEVREEIRALHNPSAAATTFLSVGSVEPRKKYDFTLSAFEEAWAKGQQVRWILAGRPAHASEQFLSRVRQHPLLGSLLFYYPDANDGEIAFLYGCASTLIFASATEGFGLPLVEARERGCRVLASDIPVFREIGDPGVTFFSLDSPQRLAEAILYAIQSWSPASIPARQSFRWSDSADDLVKQLRLLLPA